VEPLKVLTGAQDHGENVLFASKYLECCVLILDQITYSTLFSKHGCDYKGYGFACKLPRLDLTGFTKESIDERDRPVLQLYCSGCQCKDSWEGNVLVRCEGCPKAFHQKCCSNPEELNDEFVSSKKAWFCDAACSENAKRKRIVVELPRKRLPLMCAPKNNTAATSNSDTSRTRSLRETSPR
jgi:hypothetical protein